MTIVFFKAKSIRWSPWNATDEGFQGRAWLRRATMEFRPSTTPVASDRNRRASRRHGEQHRRWRCARRGDFVGSLDCQSCRWRQHVGGNVRVTENDRRIQCRGPGLSQFRSRDDRAVRKLHHQRHHRDCKSDDLRHGSETVGQAAEHDIKQICLRCTTQRTCGVHSVNPDTLPMTTTRRLGVYKLRNASRSVLDATLVPVHSAAPEIPQSLNNRRTAARQSGGRQGQ
jgi:hypothetical protein